MAGLGDIHSHATPPQSYYERAFPVGIIFFGDRAYLTGYLEGFEQFQPYLLREVVAVNGVGPSGPSTYFAKFLPSR